MVTVIALIVSATGSAETPQVPRGKGEFCVEPTAVMRKDHMKFLLHQRDQTVHKGVRTKKHSLIECVDCHVQTNSTGEFIPIDAPEQFCQVCHGFASVKLDCFECHATTPDETLSALRELLPRDQLSYQLNPSGAKVSAMAFSKNHGSGPSTKVKFLPAADLPRSTVFHP